MKVYRLDIYTTETGTCVSWHASRSGAELAIRVARRPGWTSEPLITEVKFEPTVNGILMMLTNYTPQFDNG